MAALDAFYLGQFDRATALGGRAIAEADTITPALLVAVEAVSFSALVGGDPVGAMAVLADGRARLDDGGAHDWMVVALCSTTGWIAHGAGDHDTARSEAQRGLAAARRIGAPSLLATALCMHATAISEDNPGEALAAAEESVRLTEAGAGDAGYSGGAANRGDPPSGPGRPLRRGPRLAHRCRTRRQDRQPHSCRARHHRHGADLGRPYRHLRSGRHTRRRCRRAGARRFLPWLTPPQHNRYQQTLADVAAALGAQRYAAAQQRGATMSYDQIVAYTLDQLDHLAAL